MKLKKMEVNFPNKFKIEEALYIVFPVFESYEDNFIQFSKLVDLD